MVNIKNIGGSLASDNVTKNNNENCTSNYPDNIDTIITAKEIVTNYGSIYKTTGGGEFQLGGVNVTQFVKNIADNRILDLYLKYMGIKMLTTATLVPLALIMGKDLFEQSIYKLFLSEQSGGGFLPEKIPVLDDALIGNYLKITGLSVLSLSPLTLIPLGILMYIYTTYQDSQQGGTRLITGASVPPNVISDLYQVTHGQNITHGTSRQLSYVNDDIQRRSIKMPDFNSSKGLLHTENLDVKGIGVGRELPADGTTESTTQYGIEDQNTQYKIGPLDPPDLRNTTIDPTGNTIPGHEIHPKEEINAISVEPSMAGGGSDWLTSHYSRGAVNSPGMDKNQFKSFTNTAQYISNKELSQGAANHWEDPVGTTHQHLYDQYSIDSEITGYNDHGVSSSQFGGDNDETSSQYTIDGSDGSLGPNDLNADNRSGYADVSTQSFRSRASISS